MRGKCHSARIDHLVQGSTPAHGRLPTAVRWPIALALMMALVATGACQRRTGRVTPGITQPSGVPAAASRMETLTSAGEERSYLLHVPPGLSAQTPVPLVVNLHGYTATARDQEILSGMSRKADAEGFIVVYPQGAGDPPGWRVGPLEGGEADLTFIDDLVARISAEYAIDPKRIFATGMSNGGGMVDRLACQRSDLFAAAGPVSGAYLFSQNCDPDRPVPIVAFHGTADTVVPYQGQGRLLPPIRDWAAAWGGRNGCASGPSVVFQHGEVTGEAWSGCAQGAEVVLYTIEGRGHSWPGFGQLPGFELSTPDIDATDTLWDFFRAHPLP